MQGETADEVLLRRAAHDIRASLRALHALPGWVSEDLEAAGLALPAQAGRDLPASSGASCTVRPRSSGWTARSSGGRTPPALAGKSVPRKEVRSSRLPGEAAIRRLAGAILAEQAEPWRVRRARRMAPETLAAACVLRESDRRDRCPVLSPPAVSLPAAQSGGPARPARQREADRERHRHMGRDRSKLPCGFEQLRCRRFHRQQNRTDRPDVGEGCGDDGSIRRCGTKSSASPLSP